MKVSSLRNAALRSALAAGFLLALPRAHAVDVNARIRGTVTDPSGAVIPNASVVATNVATGVKYTTKAQNDGIYFFAQLPIGKYSVSVTQPGFKTFTATGIELTIDQEYVEPIQLSVGSAGDVLEVSASGVQVNTTDMQLNNIINSDQFVEYPLIGRNFASLAQIEPGAQSSSDRFGGSINGAQSQQTSFLINGADTNDLALNTQTFTPNLDAIDQVNLVSGPLNAEYDRNSGAIINGSIKQGTNKFHGDAFEFYRDTFLNTGNYFQYSVTQGKKIVTSYHQHIFGGTVGGPILKDKAFFFFGYQGIRQRVPGTGGNATVFSDAQRGGDFSTSLAGTNPLGYSINTSNTIPGTLTRLQAVNPACAPGSQWAACLAALGGKIPTSAFDPIAAKLLNTYVPTANSGANGYVFNSVAASSNNQELGRLDFTPNTKNQFTFVGIYQRVPSTSTIPFSGASVPGFGEIDTSTVNQYTFDYVRTFSPTLVNDFGVHYTRFNYQAVYPQTIVSPGSFGFAITPENASAQTLPVISTGYFTLGFSSNGPQPRIDQVYQLNDGVSKVFGHHTFKLGYDGRKFGVSNPFSANNSGSYGFSTSGPFTSGDPGLDFLLGNSSSYAQGSGAQIIANAYLNYIFAQDTWKASDSLTLSYGIGYQIDTVLHNRQYGGLAVACFNPGVRSSVFGTAPVGINYPGDPGCSDSGAAYTRFGDVGPRIGFAYSPNLGRLSGGPGKMSLRGGFGIYYNRSEEETSLNNLATPPFGLNSLGAVDYGASAPGFANPYQDIDTGQTFANKFPYKFPTAGATPDYSLYEPLSISTYSNGFRSPYSENFQLTMEREFPGKTIARISYVGSLARRNQITYEGNPETRAGHDACVAATTSCGARNSTGNTLRLYQSYYYPSHTQYGIVDPNTGIPAYPSIGLVGSEGSSSYHALQVGIDKGATHGLQFQLSYTYSHALDNGSNYENSGYGGSTRGYNQFDQTLNYGDSTFDARQRLVFAPIYVIPSFKGHGSAFSPFNLALSGWEISGITTLATGFPYDVSYGGGSANSAWCSPGFSYYACPDEPNEVAHQVRAANLRNKPVTNGTVNNYTVFFNTGTYAVAPVGQFGNAHRDEYHGPGINNTNVVLAKNIALSAEGVVRLQLRMESDNVFNHTQFSNPSSTVSATSSGAISYGSAGHITSAASARQSQIAAKLYF